MRMKITDTFEWTCLRDLMDVNFYHIYVSVCSRSKEFEQTSIMQMNYMNLQNEVNNNDFGGVDP